MVEHISEKIIESLPQSLLRVAEKGEFSYLLLNGGCTYNILGESVYTFGFRIRESLGTSLTADKLISCVSEKLVAQKIPFKVVDFLYHDMKSSGDEDDYDNGMVIGGKSIAIKW